METVLLADDDDEDCLLLETAIREAGLQCRFLRAKEGTSVAALARGGRRPKLIFLDLHMPGKNGLQVLSDLRADPELAEVPVVLLTSAATDETAGEARRLGATFWRKPELYTELVKLVQSLRSQFFESSTPH